MTHARCSVPSRRCNEMPFLCVCEAEVVVVVGISALADGLKRCGANKAGQTYDVHGKAGGGNLFMC